jgi:hypothetical protein
MTVQNIDQNLKSCMDARILDGMRAYEEWVEYVLLIKKFLEQVEILSKGSYYDNDIDFSFRKNQYRIERINADLAYCKKCIVKQRKILNRNKK